MRQRRTTNEDYKKKKQFRGRCHRCNKVGHKNHECKIKPATDANEIAFTLHDGSKQGWLLDSGASSHITPAKEDFPNIMRWRIHLKSVLQTELRWKQLGEGKLDFVARVVQW